MAYHALEVIYIIFWGNRADGDYGIPSITKLLATKTLLNRKKQPLGNENMMPVGKPVNISGFGTLRQVAQASTRHFSPKKIAPPTGSPSGETTYSDLKCSFFLPGLKLSLMISTINRLKHFHIYWLSRFFTRSIGPTFIFYFS